MAKLPIVHAATFEMPYTPGGMQISRAQGAGLVDVLDRVLDKGLVVAGDIKVSLAEVELLTIRIRLLICSIDKAEQIGLDWWRYDRHLSPGKQQLTAENEQLREQVRALEQRVTALSGQPPPRRTTRVPRGPR
jgi:hypothetical protein